MRCILWRVRYPLTLILAGAAVTSGANVSCRSAAPASAAPPPIVQPGAPGQPSRVITAAQATDLSQVQYTGADIKFMQGMIGHHAQAIEMVALVPSRTTSDEVRKLAQRIDVSQQDEIKMMREWLLARGQQVPGSARASHDGRDADAGHADAGGDGAAGRRAAAPSSTACFSKA